jgi:hypothetical protein
MTYYFTLRPVARPDGTVEVLMCTPRGIEGAVPRPGARRGTPIEPVPTRAVPWSAAHMDLLFGFVGWNVRNVAVARWHGAAMGLTVVEEPPA